VWSLLCIIEMLLTICWNYWKTFRGLKLDKSIPSWALQSRGAACVVEGHPAVVQADPVLPGVPDLNAYGDWM